jgi:uncharacterized membrane protein YagU involved in acid resistance
MMPTSIVPNMWNLRMPEDSLLSNAIRGGIAGGVATVGMTAAMICMHRCLPRGQRYGLPPEQIVEELLERADVDHEVSHREFGAMAMLAHHGYGTAMGAVYGILVPQVPHAPPVVSGMSFGLLVWALSYLGWLPAMGMDAAATREPAQRNALTILSHLIWGGTTGLVTAIIPTTPAHRRTPKHVG